MTWRSVTDDPPQSGKLVLVRMDSGYSTYTKTYVSAYWRPSQYRPGLRLWCQPSGDLLSENGWIPEEWMELPR